MGFMRTAAKIGTFGLAGLAMSKKKKDRELPEPRHSMITSVTTPRPTSMIGSTRGGY